MFFSFIRFVVVLCLFNQQAFANYSPDVAFQSDVDIVQESLTGSDTIEAIVGSDPGYSEADSIVKKLVSSGVTPYHLRNYLTHNRLLSAKEISEVHQHKGIRTADLDYTAIAAGVWITVYIGVCIKVGGCFE